MLKEKLNFIRLFLGIFYTLTAGAVVASFQYPLGSPVNLTLIFLAVSFTGVFFYLTKLRSKEVKNLMELEESKN